MPGISLNEDNSHYFYTRGGAGSAGGRRVIDIDDIDAFVDQYAGTQVEELFFSANSMRTSFASEVWDPVWKGYDPDAGTDQPLFSGMLPEQRERSSTWIDYAWRLQEAGIDIYDRWITRSKGHGISPWISMRMNDIHNVDNPDHCMHSDFWRRHPEYRRVSHRFTDWTDRAFDYLHEEVRRYHFALIEELCRRYDFDGLELDWMRFGFHFKPGFEDVGRRLLSDFTREVRALLDEWEQRRGHPISLGARVPSAPQNAFELGLDAVTWAREAWIDFLVVTPFWATVDTDMPIEFWKQLLAGTGVTLAAGLELLIRPDPATPPGAKNSLETVRGIASSVLEQGADRVYLFNYMDSETAIDNMDEYPVILREIGNLDTLEGKPRRHVVTYTDTVPVGVKRTSQLPARLSVDGRAEFRIHIGPRPASTTDSGQDLEPEIIAGIDRPIDESSCIVYINGEKASLGKARDLAAPAPAGPHARWRVRHDQLVPGHNIIEIHAVEPVEISWLELSFLRG